MGASQSKALLRGTGWWPRERNSRSLRLVKKQKVKKGGRKPEKATKKLKFEFIYELKFHIIMKGCCKNLNKFIYKLI